MKSKEKLAEEYAEEQNSAYNNDYYGFIAGRNEKEKQIKNLYNGYNSQLKEATTSKMGRKEESYEVIKLRGKVELLKQLIDEK